MKLKEGFITHETGTEALLVPTGEVEFSGIVRGNKTLGVMLELLQNDTSEADIVTAMCQRFKASVDIIERDVKKLLHELRAIGALDE